MRRNYISPEFDYVPVYGTLNMEEESSFFGSKMLEITDSIIIGNDNLIYYQNINNEQLDLEREDDFPPIVFNTLNDKKINHRLVLDDSQTDVERNSFAKWILTIDLRVLLRNYIFATLKKYRTFEGVSNIMAANQNVDFAMKDYIERNVLNRYRLSKIDLYLAPVDLLTIAGLKYGNIWDSVIEQEKYKFTKFSTITDERLIDVKLYFSQELSASQYAFRYYFNLNFEKL
jgi:hypothetical protein